MFLYEHKHIGRLSNLLGAPLKKNLQWDHKTSTAFFFVYTYDWNKIQIKTPITLFSHSRENIFYFTQHYTYQLRLTKLPGLKLMIHIKQSLKLLHLFLHQNVVYVEGSALLQ